jgi:hypothetical protein
MTTLARRRVLLSLGVWLACPVAASAQVRASERGSVSQTIDGTVITLDYARPQVRGRSPIFGGFVKWKEVWTPGANYATTLEVNRPIQLDGHSIRPGKYSMWLVVGQDDWTMVLDPHARLYHTEPPDSSVDQVRFAIQPAEGPFTEVLTFAWPEVRPTGGTLQLRWGTTEFDMRVAVQPKHRLSIPAADAQPYLGTYLHRWAGQADSVKPSRITMAYENGMLIGHWDPAPWPEAATVVLVKIADDWFMTGTMEKGELTDLMNEFIFEFARGGGKVTGYEIRGDADNLFGAGKRE